MSNFILDTYTEDDCVFLFVLQEVALEIVGLYGAAAGEILGIEIQDDPFAAKIAEAERFAILRIQSEVRRGSPGGRRFLPCAHRADYCKSNQQKDYSYEDPDHFHFTRSTLVPS